jgi:hypothetical protein
MEYSNIPWNRLSSERKRERKLAMEILRSMRHGDSLSDSLEKTGLSKDSVTRHIGAYLFKENGKWGASSDDNLEIEMLIYDRDLGVTTIITTNSRDRSIIGSYFATVQKALKSGDETELQQFRSLKIIDSDGTEHRFVTDIDILYEIDDAQEESEFTEIYRI